LLHSCCGLINHFVLLYVICNNALELGVTQSCHDMCLL
jgi:hypothetical protein